MTTMNGQVTAEPVAVGFPSLSDLRTAHGSLLRRYREAELTSQIPTEVLDDIVQFVRQGQATGTVLDAEPDRAAAQTLLDYWDTTLYRAGREIEDATLAEFDETAAPLLDDDTCPYVGLDAFREANHASFFGRHRLLAEWVQRLRSQQLLVVLGLSGSGKSSLVQGGLVPALQDGALPGSEQWRYLPAMVPGSDPLANLARLAQPHNNRPPGWLLAAANRFRHDPLRLAALVNEAGTTPTVIVVDQFEELFTLCADAEARQAFVDNLLGLLAAPARGHRIILTMRSDYELHLGLVPELEARLDQAQARVGPLSPDELRDAIEMPAAQAGLKFEAGVVDRLIADMHNEPAGLPLLQFTLLKLWEKRSRNRVTNASYDELGGIRHALERSADELYDNLNPHEQEIVKLILLRMVRPDKGLEVTSRRVLRESLYADNFKPDWIKSVLDKLIKARLVRETKGETPEDDQVEVAHEALVRYWGRLLEWLNQERASIRARLRLTEDAEKWDAHGRPSEALLGGQFLDEALQLGSLSALEAHFLDCSVARREREQQQRRRTKRLRLASFVAVIALIVGLTCGFALLQREIAQDQAASLLSRQIADQAQAALNNGQRDLALLLGVEAFDTHDGFEARRSLLTALTYKPLDSTIIREHSTAVKGVAFSPDGEILASVDDEARIVLWTTRNYQRLGPPLPRTTHDGETVVATGLGFSPDGATVTLTTDDGQLLVWCVVTQTQLASPGESCAPSSSTKPSARAGSALVARTSDDIVVWDLASGMPRSLEVPLDRLPSDMKVFALSPNGGLLAGGGADGSLLLWDVAGDKPYAIPSAASASGSSSTASTDDLSTSGASPGDAVPSGGQVVQLPRQAKGITGLAFSRDGSRLAWGTADGIVTVWLIARNKPLDTFRDAGGAMVTSLSFSPDDKLAWGATDTHLYVRDISTGTQLPFARVMSSERALVSAAVFAADSEWVTLATSSTGVTRFPTRPGPEALSVSVVDPTVTSLALSADGELLAASAKDRALWVWSAQDEQTEPRQLGTLPAVASSLAFNSDGTLLVAGGEDGHLTLWDVKAGTQLGSAIRGHAGTISQIAVRSSGRDVASVGEDGIQLWSLASQGLSLAPVYDARLAKLARSATFSPDGTVLATGQYDGTVVLWDTRSGQQHTELWPTSATSAAGNGTSGPFGQSMAAVSAVAFSPDGKWLASGTFDGGLTLWDLAPGLPLAPPSRIHHEPLVGLSFSPDGLALASGSADTPLVIWSLRIDSWIDYACSGAPRSLTPVEWRKQYGDKRYRETCPPTNAEASAP